MPKPHNKFILLSRVTYADFLFYFAILVVVMALVLQFVFGILPCKLCYYQRIPYYVIIVFGILNYFMKNLIYQKIFFWLCVICFLVSAVFGFYHMGVEYGFFENVFNCVADQKGVYSVKELQSVLKGKINVPCEVTGFRFILSLSGWNFLVSLILGFFTLYYILVGKKKI